MGGMTETSALNRSKITSHSLYLWRTKNDYFEGYNRRPHPSMVIGFCVSQIADSKLKQRSATSSTSNDHVLIPVNIKTNIVMPESQSFSERYLIWEGFSRYYRE
ncbi:unnamed protein product [Schistosoma mansoni]|uniref:Smp_202760 n=1 Tax=Schistosoma mansoni TaxID=6183 RepID=UPI00022C8257|nr:unnamed protein product [Schistosoma mansoni]|eukprot:XP_018645632.1 unnamed protein product [Schistosoma mansoni]